MLDQKHKMIKVVKGQKVRSVYGEVLTVLFQRDNMVVTYENGLYHVTKLFIVRKYKGLA